MEDVVNRGTGTRIRNYFNYPAAGKTGTTNNFPMRGLLASLRNMSQVFGLDLMITE